MSAVLRRTHRFFLSSDQNHRQYSLHLPAGGWPGWMVWINTGIVDTLEVVTNPNTNRAQLRSLTFLMWPLRQTSHHTQLQLNGSTAYGRLTFWSHPVDSGVPIQQFSYAYIFTHVA